MITICSPFATQTMQPNVVKVLSACVTALREKKAQNIVVLDVREWSPITSYMVIAEGTVDRHVQALARQVLDECHELQLPKTYVEGMQEGAWVVVDLDEVMVHLFIPEWRQHYALEQLWPDAQLIPTKSLERPLQAAGD